MNPIRTLQDAYATLSRRISDTVDRLVSQDRERLARRETCEAEIRRRHQMMKPRPDHD